MIRPVLGVDPGVRGGMALLSDDGLVYRTWAFKPDMSRETLLADVEIAAGTLRLLGGQMAFVERVGYMPGDGGQGAFTFGRVVGWLEGGLLAHQIKVLNVSPMLWQSAMGCMTGGNKNVSKRKAQELFPLEKITHAIADALLIAEYGRRRGTEAGL